MKFFKLFTLLSLLSISLTAGAVTHLIQVEDNEFNPSNLSVAVGDTVKWFWDNSAGDHTTTSAIIPAGALSWDAAINGTSQTFTYVVTKPGSYDYICSFHAAMGMIGHFNATGGTGVLQENISLAVNINYLKESSQININYSLIEGTPIIISLFDISGSRIHEIDLSFQLPGSYSETLKLESPLTGIYILTFTTGKGIISKKIMIY